MKTFGMTVKLLLLIGLVPLPVIAVADESTEPASTSASANLAATEVTEDDAQTENQDAPNANETASSATESTATEEGGFAEDGSNKKLPLHEHPTIIAMWKRSNELRASVGLAPQRLNPALCKAAQDQAWYMARTGEFDHYVNGNPWTRASKYGYEWQVRENIAYGYYTVKAAFNGWKGSHSHWVSITSDTRDCGFGCAANAEGVIYWAGVYGYGPAEEEAPVAAEQPENTETADVATPAANRGSEEATSGSGVASGGGNYYRPNNRFRLRSLFRFGR